MTITANATCVLPNGTREAVIAEVDRVRTGLLPCESRREPDALTKLADELDASDVLNREPIAQTLSADLRAFPATGRLTETKRHINSAGSTTLFSLFQASYFPSLSLEWMDFSELPADPRLAERYASPTRPVLIERASKGFMARVVVALFPENHIDGIQEPEDSVFYFIDKFVERHARVTRPMVREVMAAKALPRIRVASDLEVRTASSWWVRLHEYHHRTGYMPIPEYLPVKSLKPLAGLEELRTDMKSVLACYNDSELPAHEASLTLEFILSERLLRYAVEGIPRPNYDAVASQLLFNYLREVDAIALRNGQIHLDPCHVDALAEFVATVEGIEKHILHESAEQVQKRLLEFTNRYTDFDEELHDYRHIEFFADVKVRLGV